MKIFLFEMDLKIAFVLAGIFLFIFPIFLYKFHKNRISIFIYLIVYLFLLSVGVFLDVSIRNSLISFSVLITNNWFSNRPIIANFDTFGVLVNLFLLFPFGFIVPLIKNINLYTVMFLGFSLTLIIEILQFTLPIIRYPELLDVLNNTISVILGYLYYLLISKLIRGEANDRISKQERDSKDQKRIR